MQPSCLKAFTKASSTEPGRELRERIVKLGTWRDDLEDIAERIVKIGFWDNLENITEIEPGRDYMSRIMQIGA